MTMAALFAVEPNGLPGNRFDIRRRLHYMPSEYREEPGPASDYPAIVRRP